MYTEKDNKTVSILGTDYSIKFMPEGVGLLATRDGATDESIKEIIVGIFPATEDSIADLGTYQRKVLRHEIIHAFLFESGLGDCSVSTGAWATNEEMVDWIAKQHNKLHAAFEQAGAL